MHVTIAKILKTSTNTANLTVLGSFFSMQFLSIFLMANFLRICAINIDKIKAHTQKMILLLAVCIRNPKNSSKLLIDVIPKSSIHKSKDKVPLNGIKNNTRNKSETP